MQSKELFLEDLNYRLEMQLQLVIGQLQNLPESVLNKPTLTGGWSITQCIAHLNSYYDYYLPNVKAVIDQLPNDINANEVKHTWLGNYFINMMQANGKSKKYKAVKKHIPPINLNGREQVATFIQHSEEFLNLIENMQHINGNQGKIGVSIAPFIKINLYDTLLFLLTHNERHLAQAKRNL